VSTALATHPRISLGAVMHARHAPVQHAFSYSAFTLCIPLSQLASMKLAMFGVNRPAMFALHEVDHGPRDGRALLPWIRALLQEHGIDRADGEIVLQTTPRLFGYVFNPVSFWYCFDREGGLRAVLAEVNNTFGDRHNYLLAHPDQRPIEERDVLSARKVFHVSPFFPVAGEYRFRFIRRDAQLSVSIDYWNEGVKQLSTRLAGRDRPLTTRGLLAAIVRCPLASFGVIVRIHWHAIRLALRRVRFHPRPHPPAEETT
jgi:uncharacterized protein